MTQSPRDKAAWQRTTGEPLHIGVADLQSPGAGQILIRNRALAVNPLDWIIQDAAALPWLDYPAIFGSDAAGEVAAVGPDVTRIKVGDRVIGQAVGTTTNNPAEGTFREHTIVLEHMAAPIPDTMTFADAAVLPLGLGTAASGLYGTANLGLAYPSPAPTPREEVVLVWGGSSSVGVNAIQLAVASGYVVISTASPRNADMLKRLGASEVFDHGRADIVDEIAAFLRGRRLAGVLHATGRVEDSLAVAAGAEGVRKVAATLPPPEALPEGVSATHIIGPSLKDDDVGPMIYRDFLPEALAAGRFVPAPPARVTGRGLEALQSAVDLLRSGVSGEKLVVELD